MVCDEVAVRSGDLRTPIKDAACRAPQRCARDRVSPTFLTRWSQAMEATPWRGKQPFTDIDTTCTCAFTVLAFTAYRTVRSY